MSSLVPEVHTQQSRPHGPGSFTDYFEVSAKLKGQQTSALALGEASAGTAGSVFETVLIGTLGADGYWGLWNGKQAGQTPR
jgi:glucose/mannose transport system substrate-binding protein